MAYAPAKMLNAPVLELTRDDTQENVPSEHLFTPALNPVIDTLEAGKRGEILFRSPLTEEQRASKRAFLAKPKPPTKELRAGLAARRNLGRRTNEI